MFIASRTLDQPKAVIQELITFCTFASFVNRRCCCAFAIVRSAARAIERIRSFTNSFIRDRCMSVEWDVFARACMMAVTAAFSSGRP